MDVHTTADRLHSLVAGGMLYNELETDLETSAEETQGWFHPNGFKKLVFSTRDLGLVRLHYWPSSKSSESDIHSHRWDFSSAVIAGEILSETFQLEPSAAGRWIAADCQHVADRYFYKNPRTVKMASDNIEVHRAGESYNLAHNALHRVRVSEESALTVVVQSSLITTTSTVIRPVNDQWSDDDASPLSKSECKDLLLLARSLLQKF